MKSAVDTVRGKIVSINPVSGKLLIEAYYTDWLTFTRRNYKECDIQFIDSRQLSDKQRKSCYALIREISDYVGEHPSRTKEYMKIKFLAEDFGQTADKIFSLSNAPMSLVCAFQKYLIRFIIDWEIPTRYPLINMVDDVADYVYACAINRKCCICGKDAEAHHHKRIGIGGNRKTMDQLGLPMEPLCRLHHSECHTMSQDEFDQKYHIEPVKIDETLKKVWGFTGKRKRKHEEHEWLNEWVDEEEIK